MGPVAVVGITVIPQVRRIDPAEANSDSPMKAAVEPTVVKAAAVKPTSMKSPGMKSIEAAAVKAAPMEPTAMGPTYAGSTAVESAAATVGAPACIGGVSFARLKDYGINAPALRFIWVSTNCTGLRHEFQVNPVEQPGHRSISVC